MQNQPQNTNLTQKQEINYICSLGTLCHSAQITKNNKLRLCSYPFDWIFSNLNNVIDCIEDDFKIFLDKSYYIDNNPNNCSHRKYGAHMFNHHNPLTNQEHYNYYVRGVNRFRNLLEKPEQKIFMILFDNRQHIDENLKQNILEFNNKLKNYTINYTLLIIFNLVNKPNNYHNFTKIDNIDFLELHTISESNGVYFNNNIDNQYINNVLLNNYNFNIKNL
jgi:hypothetical protein